MLLGWRQECRWRDGRSPDRSRWQEPTNSWRRAWPRQLGCDLLKFPQLPFEKVPEHRPMARRTSLSRLDLFGAHLLMMMFCAREVSIVHEESDLPAAVSGTAGGCQLADDLCKGVSAKHGPVSRYRRRRHCLQVPSRLWLARTSTLCSPKPQWT